MAVEPAAPQRSADLRDRPEEFMSRCSVSGVARVERATSRPAMTMQPALSGSERMFVCFMDVKVPYPCDTFRESSIWLAKRQASENGDAGVVGCRSGSAPIRERAELTRKAGWGLLYEDATSGWRHLTGHRMVLPLLVRALRKPAIPAPRLLPVFAIRVSGGSDTVHPDTTGFESKAGW